MSFPTSPVDGQIYNEYQYDAVDNFWKIIPPQQEVSIGFFARKTTHTLTSGTMIFDEVEFNEGSCYNAITGVFTVSNTGRYLFTFSTLLYDMGGSSNVRLMKNGINYGGMSSLGTYGSFSGSYAGQGGSAVVYLQQNDEITYYFDYTSTKLHAGYTWASGSFLGS